MRCFLGPPSAPSGTAAPPPPYGGRKLLQAADASPEETGQLLLRNEMYRMVYQIGVDSAAAGKSYGGSLFWLLGINGVPDSDFYAVYVAQDKATVKIIAEHVVDMRLLDGGAAVTFDAESTPAPAVKP